MSWWAADANLAEFILRDDKGGGVDYFTGRTAHWPMPRTFSPPTA